MPPRHAHPVLASAIDGAGRAIESDPIHAQAKDESPEMAEESGFGEDVDGLTAAEANQPSSLELHAALRQLGHESFRPGQREAIEGLLEEQRLLLVAPTGGGKSLCYQLLARAGWAINYNCRI